MRATAEVLAARFGDPLTVGQLLELRSSVEANLAPGPACRLGPPPAVRRLVRSPELGELRALCYAADLGSISCAARTLDVSQPALSKRLRVLEAVAGVDLLLRSTRGVSLTLAGTRLCRASRRLLEEADTIDALLGDLAHEVRAVRLAASPTIADSWLPGVLVKLRSESERPIAVELITASAELVRQMTIEGRSDLGLAALDPARRAEVGLSETVILTEELVLVVPAAHPWAAVGAIDAESLAATAIVRPEPGASSGRVLDTALAAIGHRQVAPVAEIGGTAAAIAIAIATGAPALLPASSARTHASDQLVIRRVKDLELKLSFSLLFRGQLDGLAPPARSLAQHLLACAEPNAGPATNAAQLSA
jgi:DNA-binding transcriptional LysR family regulator